MQINAKTQLCASLAFPNHTLVPMMYNAAFEKLGLDYIYVAFEPKNIHEAMQAVRALRFAGVSISRPYKVDVMQFLDDVDPVAQKI